MPRRPLKPCSHPGCPELHRNRRGRCDLHQRLANADYRTRSDRPDYRERGYDARWDREKKKFLKRNPICAVEGCGQPAYAVDHWRPHRGDRRLFWDRTNWVPMCQTHHNQKSAAENPRPFGRERSAG